METRGRVSLPSRERGGLAPIVAVLAVVVLLVLVWLVLFAPSGSGDGIPLAEPGTDATATAAESPTTAGGAPGTAEREQAESLIEQAATAAPGATDEPQEPATGIRGRVIGADGRPAVAALVLVRGADPRTREPAALPSATVTTDAEGRFQVSELDPAVAYRLQVQSSDGAVGGRRGVTVFRHLVMDVGDIALRRGGTIAGRVVADTGVPIAAARVEFSGGDNPDPVIADAKGRFQSVVLAPGRYNVSARAAGFAHEQVVMLELLEGDELRDVRLTMTAAARIEGRVIDAHDIGLADVEIFANRSERVQDPFSQASRQTQSARSDAAGRFVFDTLAAGKYSLDVSAPGLRAASVVAEAGSGVPVDIRVESATGVAGVVIDASTGAGLPGCVVRLLWRPRWNRGQDGFQSFWRDLEAETKADGSFALAINQNGTFCAEATLDDGFAPGRSEPFEIEDGQSVNGLVIRMDATRGVMVRVTDPAAAPVAQARVRIDRAAVAAVARMFNRNADPASPGTRLTDADGVVRLPGTAPGVFRVVVQHQAFAPAVIEEVQVIAGAAAPELEVRLGPGGSIEGHVRNDLAQVEPARRVIASDARGLSGEAVSDGEGRYRIDRLAPGRYAVTVADATVVGAAPNALRQLGYLAANAGAVGDNTAAFPLIVEEGRTVVHEVLLHKEIPGALVGNLLINGEAAADEVVMAVRAEPQQAMGMDFRNQARTDADGMFQMRRLSPGQYRLQVMRGLRASYPGGDVDIHPGVESRATIDIGLGWISGRVADADGQPIQGATVTLQLAGTATPAFFFARPGAVRSAADGTFRCEDLAIGEYSAVIGHAGFAEQRVEGILVRPRADGGPLAVRLAPGGWLRVRLDPTVDAPFRNFHVFGEAGEELFDAWARPADDGSYWIDARGHARGTVSVTDATGSGAAPFELRPGQNAEVTLRLGS